MHEIHYNNETHSFAFMRQRTYLMAMRSEEHTSELQSQSNLVCRLLLEKKKNIIYITDYADNNNPDECSRSAVTLNRLVSRNQRSLSQRQLTMDIINPRM